MFAIEPSGPKLGSEVRPGGPVVRVKLAKGKDPLAGYTG
jgi:hypothetical protein